MLYLDCSAALNFYFIIGLSVLMWMAASTKLSSFMLQTVDSSRRMAGLLNSGLSESMARFYCMRTRHFCMSIIVPKCLGFLWYAGAGSESTSAVSASSFPRTGGRLKTSRTNLFLLPWEIINLAKQQSKPS